MMTVGELKKAISMYSDDVPVKIETWNNDTADQEINEIRFIKFDLFEKIILLSDND
jgi:hypothetical protein